MRKEIILVALLCLVVLTGCTNKAANQGNKRAPGMNRPNMEGRPNGAPMNKQGEMMKDMTEEERAEFIKKRQEENPNFKPNMEKPKAFDDKQEVKENVKQKKEQDLTEEVVID